LDDFECLFLPVCLLDAKDSAQVRPPDDAETQAYDEMPGSEEGFDRDVNDEEMMTLAYDLEPAATELAAPSNKPESRYEDAIPTQVFPEGIISL